MAGKSGPMTILMRATKWTSSGKITIDVAIDPAGATSYVVRGVKGMSCEDLTKFLDEELGVVTRHERTGEFYEQPVEIAPGVCQYVIRTEEE